MHRYADDLALIRRITDDSQQAVFDSGRHFMVWGFLLAAGLGASYAAAVGALQFGLTWIWGAVVALGCLLSLWIAVRDESSARIRGGGRSTLAGIWLGCAVTLGLIGGAGMFGGALSLQAIPGLSATVVGLAFLATSAVAGIGGARYLAMAWWTGGTVMLFIPGLHTLLVLAAMIIVLQVIPGLVLHFRWRRDPRRVP
jgi:hypothetical protein